MTTKVNLQELTNLDIIEVGSGKFAGVQYVITKVDYKYHSDETATCKIDYEIIDSQGMDIDDAEFIAIIQAYVDNTARHLE